MGSSDRGSSFHSLLFSGSGMLGNVLQHSAAFLGDSWSRLVVASVVPFFASAMWHASRTVIEVSDSEQLVWLMMWMTSTQKSAIQRVRRLRLLSASEKTTNNMDGGADRFAPPKLEFLPAKNVSAWTMFCWWPISVKSSPEGGHSYLGRRMGSSSSSSSSGYTLTVWFAPWGTSIAKQIILQGRQLWVAKRAKKTEIWMAHGYSRMRFKVLARPSRPLSTVIVEKGIKEALIEDMKRFLGAESWYIDKGIPYRRGFLLYGSPGCGKTSLITALAGTLRLPIVFIQLDSDRMDDQHLMELMSEAPRDSIVLIEDIDCVLRNSSPTSADTKMRRMTGRHQSVTLSGLLNALDGVGAQEGRLLVMTTNHIDRLDEALIRPGRVDVKFHLKKASRSAAGQLFDQFFASSTCHNEAVIAEARSRFLALVEDGKHSFATLQGVLMTARDDPSLVEAGMQDMLAKNNANDNDAEKLGSGKHCSHCRGAPGPCSCMDGCQAPPDGNHECYAVHISTSCDNCGAHEIHGARYKCKECQDYDLCEKCYANGSHDHDSTHPFLKIASMASEPVLIGPPGEEHMEHSKSRSNEAESSSANLVTEEKEN